MRNCKHKNVEFRWWHDGAWSPIALMHPHGARICRDCDQWLRVGMSRDYPTAVRIEIRAALLCADPDDVAIFTQTEWAAYSGDEHHSEGPFDLTSFEWQAGHLAQVIDMHDRISDCMEVA